MKKHKIATIVNFCSNESRFIGPTLTEALRFSRQVIVPVCDHFFDGIEENRPLLESIYAAFPECQFIEYPWVADQVPQRAWKKINPAHFWHSASRFLGYQFLDEEIETVLFLDADEVPDGARFAAWLDSSDYMHHTVIKLANYWYFREPCHQADKFEDTVVLAQKTSLEREILLHHNERDAIYNMLPGPKRRLVTDREGMPMFHHYSWVRTKDEMLKKVRSWGHKKDRDWETLVHKEFENPFAGTDFVHGYSYKNVKPAFDLGAPTFSPKGTPKVQKLRSKETLDLIKLGRRWNFLDFKGLFRR